MTEQVFSGWRKSTRSGNGGNDCVEVAVAADGAAIGVRDSKDPNGPVLVFAPGAWAAHVDRVRSGDLR